MSSIRRQLSKIIADRVNAWAQSLQEEIINRTPKDTGKLRESIEIVPAKAGENDILTVEFKSLGTIAPYNLYVHEIKAKNYSTPGTGIKFIENPVKENLPKLRDFIRGKQ